MLRALGHAQRVWIHENYFHDFTSPGGNGAETIRFGLSGLGLSNGFGVIERNVFAHCTGENEFISNKSSANTYRYNTIVESPGTQLTLRHGNDCPVYGNHLRDTDGIRIFGDRHQVFSNYLEGNLTAINIGNGDGEVADGAPLTSHDRPDDCVLSFNALVDNLTQHLMSGRTDGLGATNTTFANNVVHGGNVVASIRGLDTGAIRESNIVWNVPTIVDMPSGGFTLVVPLLEAKARGVFRPQAGSPAIDSATGDFPFVTVDMDGQSRTAPMDKGADEVSDAPVTATILVPGDLLRLIHSRND